MDRFFNTMQPSDWDRSRLQSLLHAMHGKKVLIVGDIGLDRYIKGDVERISPEAPVPIVRVASETFKLGLAANVADNVGVLAGIPLLTGVIGTDRTGGDFCKLLKDAKISAAHVVKDKTRRTILKERVVSAGQQLLRVDYESHHDLDARTQASVIKKVNDLSSQVSAIVIEDYAKGLISKKLVKEVISAAKRKKIPALIDPNQHTILSHYKGATVLTPNKREAEALIGHRIRDDSELKKAGDKLLTSTGASYIVITLGADGVAIFSKGKARPVMIPTYAREVFDVSGAGDTVIAVLALSLAAGSDIYEAAILGNLAAGIEVGKRGTATVTSEEIVEFMERFS